MLIIVKLLNCVKFTNISAKFLKLVDLYLIKDSYYNSVLLTVLYVGFCLPYVLWLQLQGKLCASSERAACSAVLF